MLWRLDEQRLKIGIILCSIAIQPLYIVDKLGENQVDKLKKLSGSDYISPYLRAPLRSLDEVLDGRARSRSRPLSTVGESAGAETPASGTSHEDRQSARA